MKIRHNFWLVLFLSIFFGWQVFNSVQAYSDKTTHPALTQEAVKFYNHFFEQGISEQEMGWMMQGTIDEDIPPRWLNHFYDPVYNRGLSGGVFDLVSISSKDWAQNRQAQSLGDTRLMLAGMVYALEERGPSPTEYTWQRAKDDWVRGDKERALKGLGHILHLIQDMTVPDHTRNDPHPHIPGTGMGSPYEIWTAQFNPQNIGLVDKLIEKKFEPVIYKDLNQYFDSVANYSNNYFFSEDTIKGSFYNFPKISELILNNDGQYIALGYDKTGEVLQLFILKEEPNTRNIFAKQKVTIDDYNVLSAYWSRLSREAVINGAGIINLFFKEVKTHKLPEKQASMLDKMKQLIRNFFIKQKTFLSNTLSSVKETTPIIARHLIEKGRQSSEIAVDRTMEKQDNQPPIIVKKSELVSEPEPDIPELDIIEETSNPRLEPSPAIPDLKEISKDEPAVDSQELPKEPSVDNFQNEDEEESPKNVAQSTTKTLNETLNLPQFVDVGGNSNPPEEDIATPPSSPETGQSELEQSEENSTPEPEPETESQSESENGSEEPESESQPEPEPELEPEPNSEPDQEPEEPEEESETPPLPDEENPVEAVLPLISEVQINGNEFVELYNPHFATADITNYYLAYYSRKRDWDDPWRIKPFSETDDSVFIPAYGFFLLGFKDYEISETAPTPDLRWETFNLSDKDGSIVIYPFDPKEKTIEELKANVIDIFVWGEPDFVKNTAAYPAIAKNESAERKAAEFSTPVSMALAGEEEAAGNQYNSNNNAGDFVQRIIPQPQNTLSFIEPRIKPDAISNLQVVDVSYNSARLNWNAPEDKDTLPENLFYEIRYSTNEITKENWQEADIFNSPPLVGSKDTLQSVVINGLSYSSQYFFAIKTKDNTGLYSPISNIVSANIGPAPDLSNSVWAKFGANIKQNRRVAVNGPATGDISWIFNLPERNSLSEPIISQDGKTLYFGSDSNKIFALDISGQATPDIKWVFEADNKPYITTGGALALSSDNTIYANASDGYFYALNNDGTLKWKYPNEEAAEFLLGNKFEAPAIGPDGTIYFGRSKGMLYALNLDGSLKWSKQFSIQREPATIAIDSQGYLYTVVGDAFKLDPSNGDVIWQTYSGSIWGLTSAPVLANDESAIYTASQSGNFKAAYVRAFSTQDGELLWEYYNIEGVFGSMAVDKDEIIYEGNQRGRFVALDKNGEEVWVLEPQENNGILTSAAIASGNNLLYLIYTNGKIVAIDLEKSQEEQIAVIKWEMNLDSGTAHASPVLGADGALYVVTEEGILKFK